MNDDALNMQIAQDCWDCLNLRGYDFSNAKLANASFISTALSDSDFSNSILSNAIFIDARIAGVNFTNAKIDSADFSATSVEYDTLKNSFDFKNKSLKGLSFDNSFLHDFIFKDFYLKDICFGETTFYNIDFTNAYLINIDFEDATLYNANFSNATLVNVNFDGTILKNVDFTKATFLNCKSLNNKYLNRNDFLENCLEKKFEASLLGGAIGDALGYPIEFLDIKSIKNIYGKDGIKEYRLNDEGVAEISDDTQMTLFTAHAMLSAYAKNKKIYTFKTEFKSSYIDWLYTQTNSTPKENSPNYLCKIKELYNNRAAGITCISALEDLKNGLKVINDSKGCGGIMRVAPIGLFMSCCFDYKLEDVFKAAMLSSNITHKHPLSSLSSALFAGIIYELAWLSYEDSILLVEEIVDDCLSHLSYSYGKFFKEEISELNDIIWKAEKLSSNLDIEDVDAIKQIGEGWVAEEALAIAIYCTLKHKEDFSKAITSAVNHSGDSDSTGSITGNLVGLICGMSRIPKHFIENLELAEVIKKTPQVLSQREIPLI